MELRREYAQDEFLHGNTDAKTMMMMMIYDSFMIYLISYHFMFQFFI